MADNIEQISLNFALPPSSGSGASASVGGTIDVDYSTNSVSMTIAANSGSYTEQFATYTLTTPSANVYTISAVGSNSSSDTLSFSYTGQGPATVSNVALSLNSVNYAASSEPVASAAGCFAEGTRIRVRRVQDIVDVAVQDLLVGDEVMTLGGTSRPIIWLGRRIVNCRTHPRPNEIMPICISADAFGPGTPHRDLVVSPGHALCVDILGKILVPASALLNGATISTLSVDNVVYWHVELDAHDVIYAEGMPAESYIETDNRLFFASEGVIPFNPMPDGPRHTHADFCHPFHDHGPLVDAVRLRLLECARQCGWQLRQPENWDEVALLVDGCDIRPKTHDLTACFEVPAAACEAARDIWLTCPAVVPCQSGEGLDARELGLCLAQMTISDGLHEPRAVRLEDPLLAVGFHNSEEDHRWTAGRARLPASLFRGMTGTVFLRLQLHMPSLRRWAPSVKEMVTLELSACVEQIA